MIEPEVKRQIDKAIARTRIVAGMDKNKVRRAAKLQILELVETDITATLKHLEA